MLADIKLALRVTTDAFNDEINGLIDAAKADLKLAGVKEEKVNDTSDALIKRAIITYCKAHFGYDNPEAERFQQAYELLKMHLALSVEYTPPTLIEGA